jgi:8-oxo-dGTP diphosphatase
VDTGSPIKDMRQAGISREAGMDITGSSARETRAQTSPAIRIAAALLTGKDHRLLLVRKRGTQAFMQPGGKVEPHEEPVAALLRELHEELRITVPSAAPVHLGSFTAPAANEPGFTVEAEVFHVVTTAEVTPTAEIEEVLWVEADAIPEVVIAPLTRDHILPLYRSLVR